MTDPTTPILYSFRRCPYAMRARMAIAISQTPVRLREIILRDKPIEMVEASPKATVPVLVDGDNIIDESLAVMQWALNKNDPEDWRGSIDPQLIEENDGPFKHHLDRYKYATRYADIDPQEHRTAGFEFLEKLDSQLEESAFLNGDKRGFCDVAIFPFVRQFRIPNAEWFDSAPIPNVQRWLKSLMASDLFLTVMKKYPTWNDSKKEFEFPS